MANREERAVSTGAIIAIVIIVLVVLAIFAIIVPRMRARSRERQLERRRGEVADAHREQASARASRADEAEQIAARERAEADLHEARARLHERGLADDELDADRERLGDDRFARAEDPATEPDERTTPR
jgi:flagellar biosynthesis/type III secretory pathway M-ring protein FliF/YscJ